MDRSFIYQGWRDDKQLKISKFIVDKSTEVEKMVKRKTTEFEQIEAFDGKLEVLEVIEGEYNGENTKQLHLAFSPVDTPTIEALKTSKTGMLHNFIRISPKTKDDEVPEGCNLDKYLIEIESVLPEAKKAKTYIEAIEMLKKHQIHYVYKKIGRAYQGHEGTSYFVPQARI